MRVTDGMNRMNRINSSYIYSRELFSIGLILFVYFVFGPDMGMRGSSVTITGYASLGCFAVSALLNAVNMHCTAKKAARPDKVRTVIHTVLALSACALILLWNKIFL